jgi:hypothetical protein
VEPPGGTGTDTGLCCSVASEAEEATVVKAKKKLPPGIVERERTGEDGRKRSVYKATVRTQDGKQRSKTFDRLEDAKAWREDFAVAKRSGTSVDPQRGRMPYRDWRAQWWKGGHGGAAAVHRGARRDLPPRPRR